jgi:hypothetical protein
MMPYIVAVEINIDFPDVTAERTSQVMIETEVPPTLSEIEEAVRRDMPNLFLIPGSPPNFEQFPPFTFTFSVEAIFHVTPLD